MEAVEAAAVAAATTTVAVAAAAKYKKGLRSIDSQPSAYVDDPFFLACIRAIANWSGHDVDLNPQRIPEKRSMTSEAFIPFTNAQIP